MAAALATIDLLEKELMANAASVGAHLMARACAICRSDSPTSATCAASGLMIGIETGYPDQKTKERAMKLPRPG